MAHTLVEIDQAQKEWRAWRTVCRELAGASASLDIEKEQRLHAALVYWGECLHALRNQQEPQVRVNARADAENLLEDRHVSIATE